VELVGGVENDVGLLATLKIRIKMDYNIKKEKKLVYCILDNIENQSGDYSKEVARNVSDFFLSLLLRNNYDIIINNSSDSLLRRVAEDDFYSHAVVVITGTHTGLSDRIIDAVEEKCQEHFTVAGHILDRDDAYYEIHNQFFIVNLKEYKRLGCPNMGNVSWNDEHVKIEPIRSEECVNEDTEIPVWFKEGTNKRTYKHKRHGWNFVEVGLKNDAVFCDVGDSIRKEKQYLYYEYDHIFFRHTPELFNYSLICNTMVTPWNSDSLPKHIFINENKLDHLVTTGTGLNWVHNITRLGYDENTKITFIDISYSVLSFMKSLVEEWDGVDYATFYMKQLKFVPNNYNLDLVNHERRIRAWFTEFQTEFDNFQETWNKVKNIKFNFVLTDLFSNNNFDYIDPNETTLVNVSDAFNHVPYIHFSPVNFRVSRENALINKLKEISPDIWLHAPIRMGRIYQSSLTESEKIVFGKVSDFNLWDINEFNAPPWQEKNWRSHCPLTGVVRIL
jgi:hypothetical protein